MRMHNLSLQTRRHLLGLLTCVAVLLCPPVAHSKSILVKLGTLAPEGSAWHDALLEIRQKWHESTDGNVELRIYPGGALGGEAEMVRKIQRGGLDAVTISASGLTFVDKNMDCLALPLLLESYEELDYVRAGMTPRLEGFLERRKLKLLNWAEAGWIYFFAKTPIRTPADLRSQRLWIGTGQPHLEVLFKQFGFKVVPLPATEMLTALQTGLVDVIDVPPLFALLDNSYQAANYMTDLKWAPLNAATLISVRKWAQIPEEYRPRLLEDARTVARGLRDVNRAAGESAITEMQARGLNVVELSAEERAVWRADADQAYPKLRGSYVDPELFDEVMRLRDEYRSKERSPSSP